MVKTDYGLEINIEGMGIIKIECEENSLLMQQYSLNPTRVEHYVKRHLIIALGDISLGEALDDKICKLNIDSTNKKRELIPQAEKLSMDKRLLD